jgi:hypothetical protein
MYLAQSFEYYLELQLEEERVQVIGRKPEGKRPLGRPGRRWVDNIRMDFGQDDVVWSKLIWLRIGTSREIL